MTDKSFYSHIPSSRDGEEYNNEEPLTLTVEKNVNLIIKKDSLAIDGAICESKSCTNLFSSCSSGMNDCLNLKLPSLKSQGTDKIYTLPLYNILWADAIDSHLIIHYAKPISTKKIRPMTLKYFLNIQQIESAKCWISSLLHRSYLSSQKKKRIKILINPVSGRGSAVKTFFRSVFPLLEAAKCIVDVVHTTYKGHAIEILKEMDLESYDVVACCSGDGLPHEVFNGLGKRSDALRAFSTIAVAQIPCGTGNAMSCNLNGTDSASLATLAIIKGIPIPMDLVSITQGQNRLFSFLSQSVGIIAESDLATENLRFLGAHRFTYGLLVRLLKKTVYPCDIAVKVVMDDKQTIKRHYYKEVDYKLSIKNKSLEESPSRCLQESLPKLEFGTVNDDLPEGWELIPYDRLGNFYCGNMAYMASDTNFFSAALPNDGLMDLVCINGDISRRLALKMLMAVENGKFFDMPGVWYRKIRGYRIIPRNQKDGYISIDGERVPFQPFQAEIHRGLGTVISKNGYLYEALGPAQNHLTS
ncbi:Sphingoid long chain base kinase 5 [Erysiphe neolycopersici]|uniref:Sphingoid long chain base kinase 5 n=1 Tax=Erysiphe neolycopersici TaxID=212602 RepID=A0A420HVW4_9PEZI|nr:Sphingoid long chain base kinase 5 [Erysiphe neolycopersici]